MSFPGDTRVSVWALRRLSLALIGVSMFGCGGSRPAGLGVQNGHLRACPGSPNCVSSEPGTPREKLVAPFPAPRGTADMATMAEVVSSLPRSEVITNADGYLHAEVKSRIMRFVDDIEFRYDAGDSVIHVRSASRVGKGDLGVNRKRVEGLRERWLAR